MLPDKDLGAACGTNPVNIRRTSHLLFSFQDQHLLDINLLLRGDVGLVSCAQVMAVSLPAMQEHSIDFGSLSVLFALASERWVSCEAFAAEHGVALADIRELLLKGLVIGDGDEPRLLELRARDELLSSTQWHKYAAQYHFMSKWRDVDIKLNIPEAVREGKMSNFTRRDVAGEALTRDFIGAYGKPPAHFVTHSKALSTHRLPLVKRDDGLFDTLMKRKTTRVFDRDRTLALDELSIILYYVFGCHGYLPVFEDVVGLKKTSPSGGDLHPTEVYPLISKVTGIDPGLYHYNVEHHRLDLLEALKEEEVRTLANTFTAGQSYPRDAHALFIMTSRFYRNFWKYRQHERAYGVLLMDAAHLSQTFYLVCTELGLGAFVTAAINASNIEERLRLDGFIEGVVAVCGCGVPLKDPHGMQPDFTPYYPGDRVTS
jgi:putative peptide maturation dehydrogenase